MIASAMPISCDRSAKYVPLNGSASSAIVVWSVSNSLIGRDRSISKMSPASNSVLAVGVRISGPNRWPRSIARMLAPEEPRRSSSSSFLPASGDRSEIRTRRSRSARSYSFIQAAKLTRSEVSRSLSAGSHRRAKIM